MLARRNEAEQIDQQIGRLRVSEHLARTKERFQGVRANPPVKLDEPLQVAGIIAQVLLDLNDLSLIGAEQDLVVLKQLPHGLLGKPVTPCGLYTWFPGHRMNDVVAIAFLARVVNPSSSGVRTFLVNAIVVGQRGQHFTVVPYELAEVGPDRIQAVAGGTQSLPFRQHEVFRVVDGALPYRSGGRDLLGVPDEIFMLGRNSSGVVVRGSFPDHVRNAIGSAKALVHQQPEKRLFDVVNAREEDSIVRQRRSCDGQPVRQHRKP